MRNIGFDHPQGPGTNVHKACKVLFDVYIPLNMERYAYVVLVSRGSHAHHPPYPTRIPSDVLAEINEVIQGMDLLSLTTRMFSICLP